MEFDERQRTSRPWVTTSQITICLSIFALVNLAPDAGMLAPLQRWGYRNADEIWAGDWWALFTPAFIHVEIWHLAFNAYWLWVLGSRFELRFGSWRYSLFVAAAAFVTAAVELAASDTTGIGASGVGFALFGFAWSTRRRIPEFAEVLDHRTVQIFFFWLFGCMLATYLQVIAIANAAHVAGLVLGVLVGRTFVETEHRLRHAIVLALLAVAAVIPLFWCPWSDSWQGHKANAAYAAGRFDEAIDRYTQIIRRDPNAAWALFNRSLAHRRLGHLANAFQDYSAAIKIDPQMSDQEQ
jgi:rhomboid protease GluP